MGQEVLSVQRLTHGYQDRTLFKGCNFEMEKSERVALIGNSAAVLCCCTVPEPVFPMQPIPPHWQSSQPDAKVTNLLQQGIASFGTEFSHINFISSW